MSSIIKPDSGKALPHKIGTKLCGGSAFELRIRGLTKTSELERRTIQQKDLLFHRIVLALDCSGSMRGNPLSNLVSASLAFVEKALDEGSTEIALESFPARVSTGFTSFAVHLVIKLNEVRSGGSTPMFECLERVSILSGTTRVVLISDGRPTDEYNTPIASHLINYINQSIPIDTIYVSEDDSGEATMREIAEVTGGVFIRFRKMEDLVSGLEYLTPKNRKLLLTEGAKLIKGAKEVLIRS